MSFIRSFFVKLGALSPSKPADSKQNQNNPAGNQVQAERALAGNNMAKQQVIKTTGTTPTLKVTLKNTTSSSNVFCYITGLAIDNNMTPMFVTADGANVYYPESPSATGAPLLKEVAIPLGPPGSSKDVVIPRMAGGRCWVVIGAKLTFKLNPGPAIVEPSVTNPSDPNYDLNWSFCEFTYNDFQFFGNISYVDFVGPAIAMSLTNTAGAVQTVPGMAANGFDNIVNNLKAQKARDGRPWDRLIYSSNGAPLRVISPNNLLVSDANAWGDYWDSYVNSVWANFEKTDMTINTQASFGDLTGRVTNGQLSLGEAGTFEKPNARDIFSNSTGPFATGSNAARNAVIPRLAAAFNRTTLLNSNPNQFPNGSAPSNYYKGDPTNYYAKFVHQEQKDGRGYAFPYDDVVPDGGSDVAGVMHDSNPSLWTVTVGGN